MDIINLYMQHASLFENILFTIRNKKVRNNIYLNNLFSNLKNLNINEYNLFSNFFFYKKKNKNNFYYIIGNYNVLTKIQKSKSNVLIHQSSHAILLACNVI